MIGRSKRRIGRGATREVEAEWEVEKMKKEMGESKTELVVEEERKESSRRHRIDR